MPPDHPSLVCLDIHVTPLLKILPTGLNINFIVSYNTMFEKGASDRIWLAIDRSLPTPAHQRQAPETNESVRDLLLIPGFFYQEASPKFRLLSRVDGLFGDRHWRKMAATLEKSRISKFTSVCTERVLINAMWLL